MQCLRCQHEAPSDAQFCPECGAKLAVVCGQCGASNAPGHKFCKACGQALARASIKTDARFSSPDVYTPKHLAEKILVSKSALEGERKQVTVLFADVSGFTSLSERLDPEDVHGLMNRAFEVMLDEVHRYEGTVNQFLGDGIMALFGAPISHEDHAHRAAHAALGIRRRLDELRDELQRRRGIIFQVRQGVNTGLVVVGTIGTDLRMDYTAVGDTTNVAARLQQIADPGRIVISAPTHRLVDGYFYTRSLGELPLKGKTEPVPAWELISGREARTRLEVEAERGLTPFVGRVRELQLLRDAFERARAGRGQIVFVAGEPGIGKSRLLLEFRRRLAGDATWVEGHCMSFGRSIAFHPLIDLLKRSFRIEEGDGESAIIKKIERSVLVLGEDLRPILPHLRYLLSVDPGDPAIGAMDPPQRRGEIFGAVSRLTMRAGEVHPQVCVFEDLHWMDKATQDYLLSVADSVAASRVLLVLTYRPGYLQPFGERTYHTRLALDALSSEDSVQMAEGVLAAESLPADLRGIIVQKAEGNPFFIEEVVKSLQEVGAIRRIDDRYVLARPLDEVLVPDTIQDVIMARIDRLEESSKKTLQLASVIGREFTRRLLERITDMRGRAEEFLRELTAIELIYERRLFPELAYMFKHALTHDVAYNSLLVQRRKELHRTIGLAIEEIYADRVAEHYEVIAYHFLRGEEWGKALQYLREAATKAATRSAHPEAAAHLEQALGVLEHLPESRERAERAIDLRLALRNSLLPSGDYARIYEVLSEAEALARDLDDRRRLGRVTAFLAQHAWATVDYRRAVDFGGRALAIATDLGDVPLQVVAANVTAQTYHDQADYGPAIELCERNVALLRGDLARERFGLPTLPSVSSRGPLVLCLAWQGDFMPARRHAEDAIAIAEEAQHLPSLAGASVNAGLAYLLQGDLAAAIPVLERGVALLRSLHFKAPAALSFLAWGYALAGRVDEALPLFEQSLDMAAAIKFLPCNSIWVVWWGEAHLHQGRVDQATDRAVRALELARAQREPAYEAYALHLLGEIAARRDPPAPETAESRYREAMANAEGLGMRPLIAHCHLGLGKLARRAGDAVKAREHLGTATAMYREMGMTFWLEKAEAALESPRGNSP
jgi:class 3 adenylate cyclase/tetratricopeptide (TPR) repeat protein